MYEILKKPLQGKIAIKVHSGEKGNQNFLRPQMFKPIVEHLKGTIVECNTAYPGSRSTKEKHEILMKEHEWSKYFPVDILDGDAPDIILEIPNGILLKKNYIGKNTKNYDSTLVISHFKGHMSGGFGGALKQLSIGFGSAAGKAYQHSGGKTDDTKKVWSQNFLIKNLKKQWLMQLIRLFNFLKEI